MSGASRWAEACPRRLVESNGCDAAAPQAHGWISHELEARPNAVLAEKPRETYGGAVSIRPLFAILIAIAMLFAPFAMKNGAAAASNRANHHAQMMGAGHCGEQPAKDHDGKAMDKSCCVWMCAAVAIAPSHVAEPLRTVHGAQHPALDRSGHNFLAELPTPPPRLA